MSTFLFSLLGVPVHPMFVHFPIALWMSALAVFAFAAIRRHEEAFRFGRLLTELGTAAAVVTVITGFLASNSVGHDSPGHDLVHEHRNLMLAASGLGVVAVALGRLWKARAGRIAMGVALLATCAVTVVGAHHGALSVYREGVGVQTGS